MQFCLLWFLEEVFEGNFEFPPFVFNFLHHEFEWMAANVSKKGALAQQASNLPPGVAGLVSVAVGLCCEISDKMWKFCEEFWEDISWSPFPIPCESHRNLQTRNWIWPHFSRHEFYIMSVASPKKNCKIPGFGRPNCQELWPWDLRTSCRFTVLCHSRALFLLSPCHCLVHLYDLQVSFSSRQMWLWFWHSKIQSEVCNCRNVWLMFKLLIWYDMQIWNWWCIVNFLLTIKEAFFVVTTLSCYHSPSEIPALQRPWSMSKPRPNHGVFPSWIFPRRKANLSKRKVVFLK